MSCIYQSDSIAANTLNANIVSGNRFEFLDRDAYVSAGFSMSAAGLEVDVSLSARVIASRLVPVVKATSPVKPDDFIVSMAPGLAGDRLVIAARNTTGGALTLLSGICIDEVM